jgi:hypothetical protein
MTKSYLATLFRMKLGGIDIVLVAALVLQLATVFPSFHPDEQSSNLASILQISPVIQSGKFRRQGLPKHADPGPGPDPFRWSVNSANFEPNHRSETTKAKIAFGDALELALTALKPDCSGPAFTSSFQHADERQVKAIFTGLLHASTMFVGESVLSTLHHPLRHNV